MQTLNMVRDKPLICTIDHIFDAAFCQKLIEQSEAQQYEQAQITIGKNEFITDTSIRNNDRVIYDDNDLAQTLFEQVKDYLPATWDEGLWELSGLNERFRYYLYGKDQAFKPHFDGAYERSKFHKSFLTLMFYLNDDFEGGETKFYHWQGRRPENPTPTYIIAPKKGQALLFAHRQLHEGSAVVSGVKYVLRTDVMYRAIYL